MGPAFALFLFGLLAAAFSVVWLSLAAAFYFGYIRKIRWLRWLSGVPLATISFGAVAFVGFAIFSFYRGSRPEVVFKTAFDQAPPNSITNLRSKNWAFGDSGSMHLRFECSPEVMGSLVSSNFTPIPRSHFLEKAQGVMPEWWSIPAAHDSAEFYIREDAKKYFSSETEILAYDQPTGTAFYYYSGID